MTATWYARIHFRLKGRLKLQFVACTAWLACVPRFFRGRVQAFFVGRGAAFFGWWRRRIRGSESGPALGRADFGSDNRFPFLAARWGGQISTPVLGAACGAGWLADVQFHRPEDRRGQQSTPEWPPDWPGWWYRDDLGFGRSQVGFPATLCQGIHLVPKETSLRVTIISQRFGKRRGGECFPW